MIRSCKGCGGPLRFDAAVGKLSCEYCGAFWGVDEYDAESEGYVEQAPIEDDTMECTIYHCNACGAEVSINRTEASTFCIYCGNPTIVFSRIARMKKPDIILPFTVTKEQAVTLIRLRVNRGRFVPNEVKNFQVELVRGIYIPYYVTDLTIKNSMIIRSTIKSGKSSQTIYSKRVAQCHFSKITTDASTTLSDSSSERLEPFWLESAVDFDEDYLTGFYSDMSDVEEADAIKTATLRARELFNEAAMKDVRGSSKKIHREWPTYTSEYKPYTAMLPAWFLTFRYMDKPYTILVNGQTGKIVGGVPWNKAKFVGLFASIFAALVVPLTVVIGFLGPIMLEDDDGDGFKLLAFIGIGAAALIGAGIAKVKKVTSAIGRTTSSTLATFVSKRQKGG